MNVRCAHCGHVAPKKRMRRNDRDSVYFPDTWTCLDTIRCADRKYARDKARGVI